MSGEFEPVIGLEIHVQLNTKTKLFCSCPNTYGEEPNTVVCPVCLGLPGALPVVNEEAFKLAVRVAHAFRANIHQESEFYRKNYFYPDLPKGYQITQYTRSIATEGAIDFDVDGEVKTVRIERMNIEDEAAKSIHTEDGSVLLDFNRAGIPLIEIVTKPDIRSPREARLFLERLKQTLRYLGVSSCDMEKGELRVDSNISVRPVGSNELGVKVELKNLNSFKAVEDALSYEFKRQVEVIRRDEKVVQETRLWDENLHETRTMRAKEEAHDYRYFPEPDLLPVNINRDFIDHALKDMPELPWEKERRFEKLYGLKKSQILVLTAEKEVADYFEEIVEKLQSLTRKGSEAIKLAANWMSTEVLRHLHEEGINIKDFRFRPADIASLLSLVLKEEITLNIAKDVFRKMQETGLSAEEIVEKEGLRQVRDEELLENIVDEVISENPEIVEKYRKGKTGVLGFLIGQVMKKTKGKANAGVVKSILEKKLSS